MAAKVGGIYADLDLKTAKFENGLKKSERMTKQASTKMGRSFQAMGRSAKATSSAVGLIAVAAAATGAALAKATKASLDFADATAKTARRAGLSSDTLQELRHAADLSGISAEQLDAAFLKLNRRIGLFQSAGGGAGAAAFKQVGIASEIMAGKINGTEEAFARLLEEFNKLPNVAAKSAAASGFFGDEVGPKMVLLLDQGAAAIAKSREEARQFGLVISGPMLIAAEAANDKLSTLSRVMKTQLSVALVQLAPHIVAVAKAFADALPSIIYFLDGAMKGLAMFARFSGILERGPIDKLNKMSESIVALNKEIAGIEGTISSANLSGPTLDEYNKVLSAAVLEREDLVSKYEAASKKLFESTGKVNVPPPPAIPPFKPFSKDKGKDGFAEAIKAIDDQIESFRRLDEQAGVTGAALTALQTKQRAWALALEGGKTLTASQTLELNEMTTALALAAKAHDAANKARDNAAAIDKFEDDIDSRIEAIQDEILNIGLTAAELERVTMARSIDQEVRKRGMLMGDPELDTLREKLELLGQEAAKRDAAVKKHQEAQKQAEAFNTRLKSFMNRSADLMAGLIAKTATWRDALQLVLSEVIKIVAEMARARFATGSAGGSSGSGLSGLLGSVIGGIGGLFGGGSSFAPVSQAGPIGVGGLQTFHSGGTVGTGRGMGLPGLGSDERMIVAQTGERIQSRAEVARGDSGGVTIEQHIHITTGIQQTVRAEIMQLMPQIAAQSKAAVQDAKRRGGSFGAAFA